MKRKGSYCENQDGVNRGAWSSEEDQILINYIQVHGEGNWRQLSKKAGLKRSGKSCRLRWLNYLKPDIKRGNISSDEQDLIIRLHSLLGNRWSLIAGRLPGRTDSEIKNYWNTYLRKKVEQNHNHNHNIPIELRIEAPGCSKNSLGIVIEPTKSTHPMSCTEAMMPDRIVNDFTTNWDQNPFVSTPQDDHDHCSEGFLKHFDTSQLLMPFEDCSFNDAIGDTWYENWKFDDYFPLGYNLGFSLF